jgi:hypothetical protein
MTFSSSLSPGYGSQAKVHANYLAQNQTPVSNNFLQVNNSINSQANHWHIQTKVRAILTMLDSEIKSFNITFLWQTAQYIYIYIYIKVKNMFYNIYMQNVCQLDI